MKKIKMEKAAFAARILAVLCGALGWWGMLYPELTMLPDTYRIVYEEDESVGAEDSAESRMTGSDICRTFLMGDRSRVRLRSRLFQEITVLLEQERGTYVAGEKQLK